MAKKHSNLALDQVMTIVVVVLRTVEKKYLVFRTPMICAQDINVFNFEDSTDFCTDLHTDFL